MQKSFIIFVLWLTATACSQSSTERAVPAEKQLTEQGNESSREELSIDPKKLAVGTPWDTRLSSERSLYGRFFHDRAEYYIIENPELEMNGAQVESLTLVYIDGKLCKKKYELNADISSALIRKNGRFKFRPLNIETREIVMTEKIIQPSDASGNIVNPRLSRYEMRWQPGEHLTLRYRFENDSIDTFHTLEEEFSDYQNLLTAVELDI